MEGKRQGQGPTLGHPLALPSVHGRQVAHETECAPIPIYCKVLGVCPHTPKDSQIKSVSLFPLFLLEELMTLQICYELYYLLERALEKAVGLKDLWANLGLGSLSGIQGSLDTLAE